jgi:hypothetical protein
MTALIVMLPLIVVVEIALQLHQSILNPWVQCMVSLPQWSTTSAWLIFLAVLAVSKMQRIYQYNLLWAKCFCMDGLAWCLRVHGNVEMGERIAKWVLELDPQSAVQQDMCCYQTSMLLLTSGISVQIRNNRGWKGLWRNNLVALWLRWTMRCILWE